MTQLSDGRVGYIHIPDMGADGHPRVHQVVLPADPQGRAGRRRPRQRRRQRLADDHRAAARELLAIGFARTNDDAHDLPGTVFHGHMVCLLNETSASDGDIFPAMFRRPASAR